MGRIDDALRRAAATAGPVAGTDLPDRRSFATLQATTAVEDYPIEGTAPPVAPKDPVVRRPRPAPVAAQPAAAEPALRASQVVAGKLVSDPTTPHKSVEQYRRLAATLYELQQQHSIKTIMVSSAVPGEGKTLTAVNLALTLAHSYRRRVMLIDADLRRPSVHTVFDIPNKAGLGDGLRNDTGPLPIVEVTKRLTVLPAGRPDRNPTAGLTSARMRTILDEAAKQYDWIILDSPPVGLLVDAKLMSSMVDGVILVIGAGSTDYELSQRAIAEVGRDRIIGAVLNRASADADTPSDYLEHYYEAPPEPSVQ
jgi:protein-tyrosine kinase